MSTQITQIYKNKDIYVGELVNGKRHGFGKYTQLNEYIREGKWDNDKFTGYGSYKDKNGDICIGYFDNSNWDLFLKK